MAKSLLTLCALANIFTLASAGGVILTPAGAEPVSVSTWASDDTSASTIPAATSYPATMYITTTIGSIVTHVPEDGVAVSTATPESTSAEGTHKLGLTVALPVVLLFAGFLIGALFLHRARARRAAQHRRNNWASRITQGWVPDSKEGPPAYSDEPTSPMDFNAANPMSPITTLPRTHQRKESIV
ncbi:hypothetical protein FRB94_012776 [Tulasnella sp. JGI-2019a]|nr:hypothetical protein FRB94_012776 [Tulasnella sp. JGI-2019a]